MKQSELIFKLAEYIKSISDTDRTEQSIEVDLLRWFIDNDITVFKVEVDNVV